MPTYLRWLVAITSGIVGYFAFAMLSLGIALAAGREKLGEGAGALVSLGAALVMLLSALAVNDWLARRYPPNDRAPR